MGLERNIKIKNYICELFVDEDETLASIRKRSKAQGMPNIQVPSNVGKLIYCLAKLRAPSRILEIGTLGGYSAIWLARALRPQGKLISLDIDARNIEVAKENLLLAGLEDKVEFRLGRATDLLQEMIEKQEEPFDLIFIDADKENYPAYLESVLKLSSSGTLILSDNLIPKNGEIGGTPDDTETEARGIYKFNTLLSAHPRLESILIPTIVGEKGRVDALGLSIVN
jgi:predicted O-methyltransferase YrrM